MSELGGFAWRKRAGQPAFKTARKAENREDWPAVVAACKQALAADAGHLEAAWLYAVALAKTGAIDAITEPLAVAAAGDFGKWATASLDQPALQPFLATPAGAAWRRRVDADRALYAAALARAVIVSAGGDLYAVDGARWYRLTRTYGGVIGSFVSPDGHRIAYVTRTRKPPQKLSVAIADLATGRTTRSLEITAPAVIAFATGKSSGFWIGQGNTARLLDDDGKPQPTKLKRPSGPWLDVGTTGGVHLHRLPVANVTADWDDQSLASAIKLGGSNRVVTVPSPGLIDGNTLVWSPDRAHVAFVAQVSDHCAVGTPNNAAFVADAATGAVTELERANGGVGIEWLAERKLAIAGDHGVSIVELGGAVQKLDGATGLVSPRRKPRCVPDVADEPPGDDDLSEPSDAPDAGVK